MNFRRRRTLTALLLPVCAIAFSSRSFARDSVASLPSPSIQAASAILVDAETGQVLYAKNADVMRAPASTTKIMTAILLLEYTRPDDIIVAPEGIEDVEG